MRDYRLLIGGKLVPGAATMDVINPATEEVFAVAPRADRSQLDQAVAAAKAAFPAWSAMPLARRGTFLIRLADALVQRRDAFARLLTEEQGRPLIQAGPEIDRAAGRLRQVAGLDLPL